MKRLLQNCEKILSIDDRPPDPRVIASMNLLWPCIRFDIAVPTRSRSTLNIFEKTVMKLSPWTLGSKEELAELICLDVELVSFIQRRLVQLGLLQDSGCPTNKGKDLLTSWEAGKEKASAYTVGFILVDLISGQTIPFVGLEAPRYKIIEDRRLDKGSLSRINFYSDSERKHLVKAHVMIPDCCQEETSSEKVFADLLPTPSAITKAIRAYLRMYRRHAYLKNAPSRIVPNIALTEAVSILNEGELVLLHRRAQLLSSTDLVVTDGIGFSLCSRATTYVNSREFECITQLKRHAQSRSFFPNHENQHSKQGKRHEYSWRLRKAQNDFNSVAELNIDSSNKQRLLFKKLSDGTIHLYEALEWALRYLVNEYPADQWQQVFSYRHFDNAAILAEYARKVGFRLGEGSRQLLKLKKGRLTNMAEDEPELQSLLALALLGAGNDPAHPLRRGARNFPYLLEDLADLKKLRDKAAHGNSRPLQDIPLDTFCSLAEKIETFVQELFPDEQKAAVPVQEELDLTQHFLAARVELEELLGAPYVYSLSADMRNACMAILHHQSGSAGYFMTCTASVELLLQECIRERFRTTQDLEEPKEVALKKLVEAGFASCMNELPVSLQKIQSEKVYMAATGLNSTLNGKFLALVSLLEEEELQRLHISCPELTDFIRRLDELRGHGNRRQEDIRSDAAGGMSKKEFFSHLKILLEIL
ncbi:hypothetical protein [Mailhella sp.]